MARIVTKRSVDSRIYGLVLIIGALIHLALTVVSLLRGGYVLGNGTLQQSLITIMIVGGSLVYIIVGGFAIRARKPETVFVLRLATIIGICCGVTLGILMCIGMSGPGEAALGVILWIVIPLPFNLIMIQSSLALGVKVAAILPFLLPHFLVCLGMGVVGFWVARRTSSVKHGVWSTLLIAMTTTLFTLYSMVVYAAVLGRQFYPLTSSYAEVGFYFVTPIEPLLLYALVFGTIGAFMGRFSLH